VTIRFRCKCGREFEVADSAAGRKARCTDCGLTFLVPSPDAKKASASPDSSPLAQAAKAAQAAKVGQASHAARPVQASQPAGGQAARPRAQRPAPRPAAPPLAPRPAAPDAMYALQDDDDDVPMARLAVHQHPLAHLGRHKPKLTAVQAAAGISVVVALVVMVDSVVTLLGAIKAGLQGMDLIYGGAALFAGLGVIVALAAGVGSRICIGILLGGAARNVLNGPALLFMAFSKSEIVTSQGSDAVMICGVAGVVSLLAGAAYILAPLLSRPVRKYMGASYGVVIAGGVVGLLLGPLVVSTALPAPELVWARNITVRGGQASTAAGPGGSSVVLTPKQQQQKTDAREAMLDQMKDIHKALSRYVQESFKLPANLGALVGDDCPRKLFVSPTRGAGAKPPRNTAGGDISDTDVIYLFKEGRAASQFESAPNAAELIVAYSDPTCGLGEGALVIRLPGILVAAPVEWLDKPALDKQLAATNKWLKDNPPPPKDNLPDKLPGFEE